MLGVYVTFADCACTPQTMDKGSGQLVGKTGVTNNVDDFYSETGVKRKKEVVKVQNAVAR